MMNNMGDLMKKAQQMQEQMQKAQEEIAKAEVTGESGAGLVKVTMNGRHDVRKVDIDPSLLSEDKEIWALKVKHPKKSIENIGCFIIIT